MRRPVLLYVVNLLRLAYHDSDMKFCIALCCLLLPACLFAEAEKARLFGHWRYSEGGTVAEYTFDPAGTFSGMLRKDDKLVCEFGGKWTIKDNYVEYEYTSASNGCIQLGTLDRDRLVFVGTDNYVIEGKDGSRRKYSRVSAEADKKAKTATPAPTPSPTPPSAWSFPTPP